MAISSTSASLGGYPNSDSFKTCLTTATSSEPRRFFDFGMLSRRDGVPASRLCIVDSETLKIVAARRGLSVASCWIARRAFYISLCLRPFLRYYVKASRYNYSFSRVLAKRYHSLRGTTYL